MLHIHTVKGKGWEPAEKNATLWHQPGIFDIETGEQEQHISWIDILATAACRTGGKCGLSSVKMAAKELRRGSSPEELLGDLYKYYAYYHEAYDAVLGERVEKEAYFITEGATLVPIIGNDMNYYIFQPTRGGVYRFSYVA